MTKLSKIADRLLKVAAPISAEDVVSAYQELGADVEQVSDKEIHATLDGLKLIINYYVEGTWRIQADLQPFGRRIHDTHVLENISEIQHGKPVADFLRPYKESYAIEQHLNSLGWKISSRSHSGGINAYKDGDVDFNASWDIERDDFVGLGTRVMHMDPGPISVKFYDRDTTKTLKRTRAKSADEAIAFIDKFVTDGAGEAPKVDVQEIGYSEGEYSGAELFVDDWRIDMDASIGGRDWNAQIAVQGPGGFSWSVGGNSEDAMQESEEAYDDFSDEYTPMLYNKPSENWVEYASDPKLKSKMGKTWKKVLKVLKENE